jgi:DNA-binding Xre family transcriptional regulator
MKICEAVDRTILEFKLSAKDLAEAAEMTQAQLSAFRRGRREIHTNVLERLLAALPVQAQQYLLFNCLLDNMDEKAIGTLLYAISLRMRGAVQSLEIEKLSA